MLLVSDDSTYKKLYNVDDQLGDRIDIPTVILKRDEGEEIRNFLIKNTNEKVVMSIKFIGVKDNGPLSIDLFLKSDDQKSLHFFKEFEQYFNKLKSKVNFVPHYKYYMYQSLDSNNFLTSIGNNAECFKRKKYCAHSSPSKIIM
jgi:hypothetical protein